MKQTSWMTLIDIIGVKCRDGIGIPRKPQESYWVEANVVGLLWGLKRMLLDFRGDGTKLCGIPAGMYH